jgi:predicted nuclease with RNAse H fold
MDFAGTLALDAPLSKTTTGIKSLLLRAVDPLFRRGDVGTLVPIKIAGSVEKPEFGVDVKRVLRRN